jgi:hypothetical protein
MRSGRVTVVAALGSTQTLAWASSYYLAAILHVIIWFTASSTTLSSRLEHALKR